MIRSGVLDILLIAQLIVFTVALAALYWLREHQSESLRKQEFFLRRFAEGVSTWRNSVGIPSAARQAIEILVDMPLDKRITRGCARAMLHEQRPPRLENNAFWVAREELDPEKREAFDWLLLNYFFAMTHSDWLTGPFIRRFRISGLSKETQAEVAIETVFSRRLGRAAA